jgi:UDPglucose 6-dehydrogenase
MNIVVIGVGYVGLVTGLSLAKLGHKISFLDIDSSKISSLSNGIPSFFEPKLDSFLINKEIKKSTKFFDDYASIDWKEIDVVLICVQTPVDESGELNSSFMKKVFNSLQDKVNEETVVCIKSTIHPSAIDEVFKDISLNYDDLVFNPEFLREGSAFEDFFQSDRIIIGSNNKQNREIVAKMYDGLNAEVLFMNPISSQLVKYLSNAYLPMRLSFVNEAARLIDALNANQKDVLRGVGLDSRIGTEYFRPSPGWGGSCFPKDVKELQSLSKLNNLNLSLIETINQSNEEHIDWFTKKIINLMIHNKLKKVILFGASFKENTDDIRYSPSLQIYNNLIASDIDVSIYDDNFNFPKDIRKADTFVDDSLVVEMYPQEITYNRVKTEIEEMNNLIYFRIWDS